MDPLPKRMTRAQAAATASASTAVRTTRIMTAAAKAKAASASAAANTTTATNKRKTRADDEYSLESHVRARRPRREKKSAATETATATSKASSSSSSSSSLSAQPIRATRSTRAATKEATQPAATKAATQPQQAKASTAKRGRPRKTPPAASTSRAATVSKPDPNATRKRVKFDDLGKENIEPSTNKESSTDSLRAAPARRPPTPARNKSASADATTTKKPLSPKKMTQVPVLCRENAEASSRRNGPAAEALSLTPVKKSAEPAMLGKGSASAMTTTNAVVIHLPENVTANLDFPPRRPPTSPNKDTLRSPAKKMGSVPFPGSAVRPNPFSSQDGDTKMSTSFKNTIFQTPAKRPPSPIKAMAFPSAHKSQSSQDAFRASLFQSPAKRAHLGLKSVPERPIAVAICETPVMKPIAASTSSVCIDSRRPSEKLTFEQQGHEAVSEALAATGTVEGLELTSRFNGRLSAVVPRNNSERSPDEDDQVNLIHTFSFCDERTSSKSSALVEADASVVDQSFNSTESTIEMPVMHEAVSPRKSVAAPQGSMYQLRDKDLDPCHDMSAMSDSEEELGGAVEEPCAFTPSVSKGRRSTMGITSLAQRLGSWSSDGQTATDDEVVQSGSGLPRASMVVPVADSWPAKASFFDEQIQSQDEEALEEKVDTADGEIADVEFDEDIVVTGEDVALAEEAEELSHLHVSPCAERSVVVKSFSDSLSEASQEYGDENELPLDPALASRRMWPPITPARPAPRGCSTTTMTTKVPLKPADESSPTKTRRFSGLRIHTNVTAGSLPNGAMVATSYSSEKTRSSDMVDKGQEEPCTPGSKCDAWSGVGTAVQQTPRQGGNLCLLRGAIVFVDVHTSEGADASLIFMDLLTQMGAKCVKTWSWNPDSLSSSEASGNNKVGITHVVFKDGGKRTMEKVRKSNGVVQCVGVGWVLDCEKANEWLDEAPYHIDTSFVPRGGARRRKSMEPKALANKNGTIVSTPARQTSSSSSSSSYNRRQSGIWVRTPPERTEGGGAEQDDDGIKWSDFILTPVPKTPAPEALSKYAMEEELETATCQGGGGVSPCRQDMLMRTCPRLRAGRSGDVYEGSSMDDADGVLGEPDKDEPMLMRLMAARRKSLQFAPKVASPLSKSWN